MAGFYVKHQVGWKSNLFSVTIIIDIKEYHRKKVEIIWNICKSRYFIHTLRAYFLQPVGFYFTFSNILYRTNSCKRSTTCVTMSLLLIGVSCLQCREVLIPLSFPCVCSSDSPTASPGREQMVLGGSKRDREEARTWIWIPNWFKRLDVKLDRTAAGRENVFSAVPTWFQTSRGDFGRLSQSSRENIKKQLQIIIELWSLFPASNFLPLSKQTADAPPLPPFSATAV